MVLLAERHLERFADLVDLVTAITGVEAVLHRPDQVVHVERHCEVCVARRMAVRGWLAEMGRPGEEVKRCDDAPVGKRTVNERSNLDSDCRVWLRGPSFVLADLALGRERAICALSSSRQTRRMQRSRTGIQANTLAQLQAILSLSTEVRSCRVDPACCCVCVYVSRGKREQVV